MFRHPRKRTRRLLFTVIYSTLGVVFSGLFVYLLVQNPYDPGRPQPISIAEEMVFPAGSIDESRSYGSIRITSPAPLNKVALVNGEPPPFEPNIREWFTPIEPDPSLVTVVPVTSEFLGRKRIRLDVTSITRPDQIVIRVESDEELIIYDANFPYSYETFGVAQIHIGRFPRVPFFIEFTTPAAQTGEITVEARFEEPASAWSLEGANIDVTATRRVLRSLDVARMN